MALRRSTSALQSLAILFGTVLFTWAVVYALVTADLNETVPPLPPV